MASVLRLATLSYAVACVDASLLHWPGRHAGGGTGNWGPAKETNGLAEIDPAGWTPKPTAPPAVAYPFDLDLRRRQQSTVSNATCGFPIGDLSAPAISCNDGEYCFADSDAGAAGCCDQAIRRDCRIPTTCIESRRSQIAIETGQGTLTCGDDPSRPHCVTYLYDVDFFENLNGYSFLACGEDAGSSTIATSPLPGWTPTSDPTTADQSTSGVSLSTSGPVTVTIFPSESPTPPTRPDAPARSTSSGQNRAGAIAGGVIGGLAGLALIGAAIFFLLRHRRRKTQEGKEYAGSPPYTSRDFPAASVYPGGIPEPYYNSDFYGELPPQMIDTSTQHIASYPPPTSLDPIVIPRDSRDTQHSQNTHTHTHAHTHNTQSQQPRMSSHARPSTYVPPLQQQRQPTAADDIVSPITPGDPLNPADDPASYTWISNPTPPPPQQQQHHQSASEYSEFSPPPPAHFQTYRPYSGT